MPKPSIRRFKDPWAPMARRRKMISSIRQARTEKEVIVAVLRNDHGHDGHEQTCATCVRRATLIVAFLVAWRRGEVEE